MKHFPLLAVVALTEDLPGEGLTRGQIGTVFESLEREGEHALLVEFSDEDGQRYALATVRPDQLFTARLRQPDKVEKLRFWMARTGRADSVGLP